MAAARAEARRKAILARGNDRLAKLTTSARGEDSPVYVHDDPPLPNVNSNLKKFIGEESSMPGSSNDSRAGTPASYGASGMPPDPSAWSPEQQQQFMQAMMGGMGGGIPGMPQQQALPSASSEQPMPNDPLAALMAQMQGPGGPGQQGAPAFTPPPPKKPPTVLQKLLPLIHLLSVWALLAYFVIWHEPALAETFDGLGGQGGWGARWAQLVRERQWAELQRGVESVPFFWAFGALQIALHSLRIFSGYDAVQPPFLLALALPHIPPPFPTLIVSGLKYVQMGGIFLDDLAGLLVGVGVCVLIGGVLDR